MGKGLLSVLGLFLPYISSHIGAVFGLRVGLREEMDKRGSWICEEVGIPTASCKYIYVV